MCNWPVDEYVYEPHPVFVKGVTVVLFRLYPREYMATGGLSTIAGHFLQSDLTITWQNYYRDSF